MAQAVTYAVKSATFKSTSITDIESVENSVSGSPVVLSTDASTGFANGLHMDMIQGGITISSSNTALENEANFAVGATGSLVLTFGKREQGKGFVSGQDKTATFPAATVTDQRNSAGSTGKGSFTLTLTAVSDSSNALVTYA